MSKTKRMTVPAGLSSTVYRDGSQETSVLVQSGEVTIDTVGGKPTVTKYMIDTMKAMDREARDHAKGAFYKWRLYLAITGRLWFIEVGKGGDFKKAKIEYMPIDNLVLSSEDGQPDGVYKVD